VGEEEEYTLGKSITEGNMSFGGRTVRSPEVVAAMKRKGRRRKKEGLDQTIMYSNGVNLASALWSKGTIEGGTLLSTVA
jgi:hypothetical protein